jgi:hypothetical protein
MNRRDSLKYLFAASGSLVALPSWAEGWTSKSISHLSSFTPLEQEVLASVVDTIIPAGNSFGALSVGVDKFLMKLLDNCYEADVLNNVKTELKGLAEVEKPFTQRSQKEREEWLTEYEKTDIENEYQFIKLIKAETIRGFSTSKEVMLNHLKYKIAPGHYYGCVDVKA